MPRYIVTEPCFFKGVYRTPTNKHAIVTTDKALKPKPKHLKKIEDETDEEREARKQKEAVDQQLEQDRKEKEDAEIAAVTFGDVPSSDAPNVEIL